MSRSIATLLALSLIGCSMKTSSTPAPTATPTPVSTAQRAERLLKALQANDVATAEAMFDGRMKQQLKPETFKAILRQSVEQYGAIQSWTSKSQQSKGEHTVHVYETTCEKGKLFTTISVNPAGEISGLFMKPAEPATYEPPPVDPNAPFRTEDVKLGTDPWILGGTLTLPKTDGPFPAAVLISGSGPNDRDATVAANRPFKDIAEGLSAKGIAVLRFDKRTFTHGAKMASPTLTVEDEFIADAVSAVQLLKARPDIDAKRIFVIGHSQGGFLAPEISVRAQPVAGVVMLAPGFRPIPLVYVEQLRHLGVGETQVTAIEMEAKRLLAGNMKPEEQFLNVSAHYWMDLQKRDQVAFAKKLSAPVLILRGSRDYQATDADLNGWRSALHGRAGTTIEELPGLNHLFLKGEGKSMPAEYQIPGHVDATVVEKIAGFMTARDGLQK